MDESAGNVLKPKYVRTTASKECWYVHSEVTGQNIKWLIDTGASPNVLNWETFRELSESQGIQMEDSDAHLKAADGNDLKVHGETKLQVQLGEDVFLIPVVVAELGGLQGMLGMDFLSQCVIDSQHGRLLREQSEISLHRLGDNLTCSMFTQKRVRVPASSEVVIEGQLSDHLWCDSHTEAALEPHGSFLDRTGLMMPRALVKVHKDKVLCTITNFGAADVHIPKGTPLACIMPIENIVCGVTEDQSGPIKSGSGKVPEYLHNMVNTAAPNITPSQMTKVNKLIGERVNAFASPDGPLGRTSRVKHTIDTGDSRPIKLPPRRMSEAQRRVADDEVEKNVGSRSY